MYYKRNPQRERPTIREWGREREAHKEVRRYRKNSTKSEREKSLKRVRSPQ